MPCFFIHINVSKQDLFQEKILCLNVTASQKHIADINNTDDSSELLTEYPK